MIWTIFTSIWGRKNGDEVLHSGVDILGPIAAGGTPDAEISTTQWEWDGGGGPVWCGGAVGDGACAARDARASIRGTVTLAFVVQQWAGSRGLNRVLRQLYPDELVYVGRARAVVRTAAAGSCCGRCACSGWVSRRRLSWGLGFGSTMRRLGRAIRIA